METGSRQTIYIRNISVLLTYDKYNVVINDKCVFYATKVNLKNAQYTLQMDNDMILRLHFRNQILFAQRV